MQAIDEEQVYMIEALRGLSGVIYHMGLNKREERYISTVKHFRKWLETWLKENK